ncbi:hypothetical protein PsAD26_00242 [Pseudovibrio sp. Ad26]|jgi:hypothetical protein|nr:hypothetical protein PsAD26_00242 [Pseudovibrio sp. Ad26]KZL26133.1 hypothetical protein PsWM33_01563 [Pseudovibrio sp. WM33]
MAFLKVPPMKGEVRLSNVVGGFEPTSKLGYQLS